MSLNSLAQAIAQEEQGLVNGSLNSNTVGMSANNPLNLEMGDIGYGTATAAGGQQLTIFASLQDGWDAATNMLNKDVSGNSSIYSPNMTLQEYMNTFTGGNQNAGNTVASILNVPSSTPISSFGNAVQSTQPSSTASTTTTAPSNSSSTPSGWWDTLKGYLPGTGAPGVTDIVAIIAGLVLISGMVFGFRQLAVTVQQGVKSGAALAA